MAKTIGARRAVHGLFYALQSLDGAAFLWSGLMAEKEVVFIVIGNLLFMLAGDIRLMPYPFIHDFLPVVSK